MTAPQTVRWRKASRTAQESACVELPNTMDAVRDSKNPGPILPGNIPALLAAVKDDRIG
jgi:Domain of unknown function (DUF397)